MYTNKTILITKEICQIIGIQDDLQNMGFQPLTVENDGADVLQKAALMRPYGIIMQFLLRDLDAVTIIQKLRETPDPTLCFVIGTGDASPAIEQITKSGIAYYICIPTSTNDMNKKGWTGRVNRFVREELDHFTRELAARVLLMQLGIPPGNTGYNFIRDGVLLLSNQISFGSFDTVNPRLIYTGKLSASHSVSICNSCKKVLH